MDKDYASLRRKNCSSRLSRDYGEFFSEITSQDWEGNVNTDGREILFLETKNSFVGTIAGMMDTYEDIHEKEATAPIPEPLKIIGAPFLDSVVEWVCLS